MEHCHNNRAPTPEGFWAKDRVFTDDRWVTVEVWIPHRMTLTCQQPGTGAPVLPGCLNCKELNV